MVFQVNLVIGDVVVMSWSVTRREVADVRTPRWQSLVADCTPPEERGRMMGLMGSIAGLASTPASYVGGYLYDNVSPKVPFYMSFVLDALSTVVFVTMFKENREQGEPDEAE